MSQRSLHFNFVTIVRLRTGLRTSYIVPKVHRDGFFRFQKPSGCHIERGEARNLGCAR